MSKLRKVDNVDKMRRGILNFIHRLLGGKLYHCWFCRLQFYDSRPVLTVEDEPDEATVKPGGKLAKFWKLTG